MTLPFICRHIRLYQRSLFLHFLKGWQLQFNSVRQSLKLCQNASYPRYHPDLNNLERDKTHTERRNHLWRTAAFEAATSPSPSLFPEASSSLYQWWQVPIKTSVAQGGGGRGRRDARGGAGKETWNVLEQLLRKIPCQCVVWGKEVFSPLWLLISNRLFTSFYKLESLCCSKGSKTNLQSARIKLLCCQRLAGLLVVLTSSATAECQTTQEILVFFWPELYEYLK